MTSKDEEIASFKKYIRWFSSIVRKLGTFYSHTTFSSVNVLALNDDKCSNEIETAYTTKSSLAIDYLYRFSKDSNYWKYILVIKI